MSRSRGRLAPPPGLDCTCGGGSDGHVEAHPAGYARWQGGASVGHYRPGAQNWFQTKLCRTCALHACSCLGVRPSRRACKTIGPNSLVKPLEVARTRATPDPTSTSNSPRPRERPRVNAQAIAGVAGSAEGFPAKATSSRNSMTNAVASIIAAVNAGQDAGPAASAGPLIKVCDRKTSARALNILVFNMTILPVSVPGAPMLVLDGRPCCCAEFRRDADEPTSGLPDGNETGCYQSLGDLTEKRPTH
jgi:hypothetical protein